MSDDGLPLLAVDEWLQVLGAERSPDKLVPAFEQAAGGVWRRAQTTMGSTTLVAVGEAVLYDAIRRYPVLKPLKIDAVGLSFRDFVPSEMELDGVELREGMRFFLSEFIGILGRITGNVLTLALIATLKNYHATDALP